MRILYTSCRIRSDSQTTGLTLTTGFRWICMKRRGASNMNIHYDVTGLLSAVWKVTLRSHMGDIKESASTRQLDR